MILFTASIEHALSMCILLSLCFKAAIFSLVGNRLFSLPRTQQAFENYTHTLASACMFIYDCANAWLYTYFRRVETSLNSFELVWVVLVIAVMRSRRKYPAKLKLWRFKCWRSCGQVKKLTNRFEQKSNWHSYTIYLRKKP